MPPKEIDLGIYVRIIRKRLWLVIVCVSLSTIAAAVYNSSNYQPYFQASTKLLVNKTAQPVMSGNGPMDVGGAGSNVNFISTYNEIIKTSIIMEKVAQRNPQLNLTAEQLASIVKVFSDSETQMMTITAIDSSYERAANIVNAVAVVFQAEVPKIFKVDNVTIFTKAEMKDNPRPINEKNHNVIILGFAASLIAAIGIVLFLDSLDDTVKTEEDIRLILEKPLLSAIPKMNRKELISQKKKISAKVGEGSYAPVKN